MTFEPTAPMASPTDVRVFAEIGSMDDIHAALRARFDDLELSRATIDHAAGLTDGYAGKLLAVPPIKRFGQTSLFPTLEVAGLRLALIEDAAALTRTRRLEKRARNQVRCKPAGTASMIAASRPAVLRELATKGGKARMAKLTSAARRRLAKAAAKARWSRTKRGRKTA